MGYNVCQIGVSENGGLPPIVFPQTLGKIWEKWTSAVACGGALFFGRTWPWSP